MLDQLTKNDEPFEVSDNEPEGLLYEKPERRRMDRRRVKRFEAAKTINIQQKEGTLSIEGYVNDLSLYGALIVSDEKPTIGEEVSIGMMAGKVTRHTENGFAVEFSRIENND